jgi:micrococcal nuclease
LLQEELVAKGLARVYSFPDNRACVAELLARSPAYRIQDALDVERLGRLTHSYQLVEGTVASVGQGGGRIYLNFAKDWRSDFTISVERKDAAVFTTAAIDLKDLNGKRVRVRGWVEWRNGPMIEATYPEQIEILPDAAAPGRPSLRRSHQAQSRFEVLLSRAPPGALARRPPHQGGMRVR